MNLVYLLISLIIGLSAFFAVLFIGYTIQGWFQRLFAKRLCEKRTVFHATLISKTAVHNRYGYSHENVLFESDDGSVRFACSLDAASSNILNVGDEGTLTYANYYDKKTDALKSTAFISFTLGAPSQPDDAQES